MTFHRQTDGGMDRLALSRALFPLFRSRTLAEGHTETTAPRVSLATGGVDLMYLPRLGRIRERQVESLSEAEEREDEGFLILAPFPMGVRLESVGASRVTPVSMDPRYLNMIIRMNAAS